MRDFKYRIDEVADRLAAISGNLARHVRETRLSRKLKGLDLADRIALFENALSGGRIFALRQKHRDLAASGRIKEAEACSAQMRDYRLRLHGMPEFRRQMSESFERHEAGLDRLERAEERLQAVLHELNELTSDIRHINAHHGVTRFDLEQDMKSLSHGAFYKRVLGAMDLYKQGLAAGNPALMAQSRFEGPRGAFQPGSAAAGLISGAGADESYTHFAENALSSSHRP